MELLDLPSDLLHRIVQLLASLERASDCWDDALVLLRQRDGQLLALD